MNKPVYWYHDGEAAVELEQRPDGTEVYWVYPRDGSDPIPMPSFEAAIALADQLEAEYEAFLAEGLAQAAAEYEARKTELIHAAQAAQRAEQQRQLDAQRAAEAEAALRRQRQRQAEQEQERGHGLSL